MDIDINFPYHSITAEETLQKLQSQEDGLTNNEAVQRRNKFGINKLEQKNR